MTPKSAVARVFGELPPAILRARDEIEAELARSALSAGVEGRVYLAWEWALTGQAEHPVTSAPPTGRPPTRAEIRAEAQARPPGSDTDRPGDGDDSSDLGPADLGPARAVLSWLIGDIDELPTISADHSEPIDLADDYVPTMAEISRVRELAGQSLAACDLPDPMDPGEASRPWEWSGARMNAAWLRGVRDLLIWILGERDTSPLRNRIVDRPSLQSAAFEAEAAEDVISQGRLGGSPVDPVRYPPPQYGEGLQAAFRWLSGESSAAPVDEHGCGHYVVCPDSGVPG